MFSDFGPMLGRSQEEYIYVWCLCDSRMPCVMCSGANLMYVSLYAMCYVLRDSVWCRGKLDVCYILILCGKLGVSLIPGRRPMHYNRGSKWCKYSHDNNLKSQTMSSLTKPLCFSCCKILFILKKSYTYRIISYISFF